MQLQKEDKTWTEKHAALHACRNKLVYTCVYHPNTALLHDGLAHSNANSKENKRKGELYYE